jgi:hypothetical protein
LSYGALSYVIEAFCIHARNLIKFFDENGQSKDDVRAKHFCNNYACWTLGGPSKDLRRRLNKHVAHLTYDRSAQNEDKVGDNEQLELIRLIDREIEILRNFLKDPYKDRWPFDKASTQSTEQIVRPRPVFRSCHQYRRRA